MITTEAYYITLYRLEQDGTITIEWESVEPVLPMSAFMIEDDWISKDKNRHFVKRVPVTILM